MKRFLKKEFGLIVLLIIFIVLFGVYVSKNDILSFNGYNDIDRVLQTKEYNYLPKEAQNYIKEVYEKTGEIVLTEKNKKDNTPYLNPAYVDYLTLNDSDKNDVDLIPNSFILDYQSVNYSSNNQLPSKYDLRDVNGKSYITPMKNQGHLGLCWAFATIEQAESYLMVKNNQPYNENSEIFSVRQLDYATSTDGIKEYDNEYGFRNLTSGGLFSIAINAISNGVSLVHESVMPYSYEKNQKDLRDVLNYGNSNYEVNSTLNMPVIITNSSQEDKSNYINIVKDNIVKYGGAYVSAGAPSGSCSTSNYYDNSYIVEVEPRCYRSSNFGAHAMQIIGWDDDYKYKYCEYGPDHEIYSKDKELCNVHEGQGAWIIRNSWGTNSQYQYVYLSYNSVYIFINFITGMSETKDRTWDNSYIDIADYFGDYYVDSVTKIIRRKVDNNEKISKVKFVTASYNGKYEIKVNDNYSYVVDTDLPGLYSVDLSDLDITIDEEYFEVTISSLNDTYLYDNVFVYTSNVEKSIPIIYTKDKEFESSIVNDNGYQFTLYSITRNIPSNGEIVYKLFKDGNDFSDLITYTNNYVAENNVNSNIKIDKNISSGEYVLKTYYKNNNEEQTCDVCNSKLTIGKSISLSGNGTKSSPYLINNQEELAAINYDLNAFYKLNKDIEIDGEWVPIGTDEKPFNGVLDGNNHTISNLRNEGSLYGGLFGVVSNEKDINANVAIKKLKIKNFDIDAVSYAGAIVAKIKNVREGSYPIMFSNIYIYNSKISSINGVIGSVVGQIDNDEGLPTVRFDNIFSNATLIDGSYSGGIIGLTDYTPVDLQYIQYIGDIITTNNKDGYNHGTILNYPDFSGIEPGNTSNMNTGFLIMDSISNGLIIGKEYLYTHISNFGFDEPNYNLSTTAYLKRNSDIYNYDLSLDETYTVFNSIIDMKDINKYNWEIDDFYWQFKTIDGISRIPILWKVDFEYTKVNDIELNVGEKVNLLNYITPYTRPCRLEINVDNMSDVINIENSDGSICDYDINIVGNKVGSTKFHLISSYDGYERDINVVVKDNLMKGDMNQNGKIDLKDIIVLIRKYTGSEIISDKDVTIGDINDNDRIDLKDIILLIKTYLGSD